MAKGLANEGFDIDLAKAGLREDAFANVLFRATVEHKCEIEGVRKHGGNLFIEFEQKGRPSGLATTKAEFWAEEISERCWIVLPVQKLKLIARIFYKRNGKTRGGDYDNYLGVLIPLPEFITHCWKTGEELEALADGKCHPINNKQEQK